MNKRNELKKLAEACLETISYNGAIFGFSTNSKLEDLICEACKDFALDNYDQYEIDDYLSVRCRDRVLPDAIHERADSLVHIYNNDLWDHAKVFRYGTESALEDHVLEGPITIEKLFQMGEYECYVQGFYENEEQLWEEMFLLKVLSELDSGSLESEEEIEELMDELEAMFGYMFE